MQDGDSVQRLCALMVCSAFRTVSHDAALVISGGIQIDLLTVESANIRAGSTGVATAESLLKRCRELTIAKWQERWVNSSKGRWTYKLIPELQRWLGRKHGHVDFYLTQLLTGHGCFKYYLNRFKHERYPHCPLCESDNEDAEHVFLWTFYWVRVPDFGKLAQLRVGFRCFKPPLTQKKKTYGTVAYHEYDTLC